MLSEKFICIDSTWRRKMKKHLYKFETTLWLVVKAVLYFFVMAIFIYTMGKRSIGLTRLSRTMGITIFTFVVVGLLFLNVYGRYDVGRRKSKPIIHSLALATLCTDLITFLQIMIMKTNTVIHEFRVEGLDLLVMVFVVQLVVIILFSYGGNALFFLIHEPEKCCVITTSQKSLDEITYAVSKFKKQYQIQYVLDYRQPDMKEVIRNVDTVFAYDVPVEKRTEILRLCYKYKVNVYYNPDIEDVMGMNATQYVLDDIYLMNKNVKAMSMEQRIIKRLMDIIIPLVLGIVSSPIWLLAMVAIKLYDGGPIFFKQERATIHGKKFYVYKLRTMKVDAEIRSAGQDDDRITGPGRFLRKTRIDELPQLINVLKGDMSFVGPRPEMMKNVEMYTKDLPEFKYRLRMKAGLTGYAQVAGKYNTTPKDKLIMDMMYIEQFSILRDIQLIFQTVIVLLKKDSTEGFHGGGEHFFRFEEYRER